ncbi:MAG: geranylgeranylglycerol-phosphate geranylgeranyltransferase [Chloroflexi bacterium]|nr:geranylgeranylglycerol-phosphate geranylgeranyltransferase [Chloroflexota bacterium]
MIRPIGLVRVSQWHGLIRLVRLSNSVPASILVLIGAYLARGWPLTQPAWLAAAAMWCVTAFGYTSNDCFDLTEDKINKPDRPIPAGLVAASSARWLAALLALGALSFSLCISPLAIGAAFTVLSLLTLYNVRLKATPGGGNVLIALLAGCTLLVGAVAVAGFNWQTVEPLGAPALVLASFITAREILKTLEDVEGDRVAGKQTLATQWGAPQVMRLIGVLSVVTLILSLIPFLQLGYSHIYLWMTMLGVNGPLFFTTIYLWHDASPQRVSRCLALLKGSYFAGILALLLA